MHAVHNDSWAEPRSPDISAPRGAPSQLPQPLESIMERLQRWFGRRPSYEPLLREENEQDEPTSTEHTQSAFSWLDYCIFLLVGVSMLWAW